MNKKFVYQVGNNKKSYTMMHSQPNIKLIDVFCHKFMAVLLLQEAYICNMLCDSTL